MKKLLFLAPRLPYPLDTGGKIRTYHILRLLSNSFKVDLLCFVFNEKEKDALRVLKKELKISVFPVEANAFVPVFAFKAVFFNRPLVYQKYMNSYFAKVLRDLIVSNEYDVVHCDHLHMAQYVSVIKKARPEVFVRMDEHNIEYVISKRAAEKEDNPFMKMLLLREWKKVRDLEINTARSVDEVWVVSDEDKSLLEKEAGISPVVVPNGVDLDFFAFRQYTGEEKDLVFIGSMDWLPNEDGVLFFLKEIFPLIKEELTGIKFYVVGRNPSPRVMGMNDDSVVITGAVDDVRDYLYKGALSVVPLRIGGGSRLKILESMAAGRVVVSTKLGAEGIDYTNGQNIVIADKPREFADAVVSLIKDKDRRLKIAEEARRFVEENYSWKIP